jgi:hypothetical protein
MKSVYRAESSNSFFFSSPLELWWLELTWGEGGEDENGGGAARESLLELNHVRWVTGWSQIYSSSIYQDAFFHTLFVHSHAYIVSSNMPSFLWV